MFDQQSCNQNDAEYGSEGDEIRDLVTFHQARNEWQLLWL
jgi:hypothetical protein